MAENNGSKLSQTDEGVSNSVPSAVELGQMLREMRESAGYSVESLSTATCIMDHFIMALEAGELDKTPGSIFCRGFIKIISKTCGEDSEKFLAIYDRIIEPAQEADERQGAQRMHRLSSGLSRVRGMDLSGLSAGIMRLLKSLVPNAALAKISRRGWMFLLGFTALSALAVFGLFRLSHSSENFSAKDSRLAEKAVSNVTQEEVIATKDEVVNDEAVREVKAVEPKTVVAEHIEPEKPTFDRMIGSGSQTLVFQVKKEVKVRIKVDKEAWITEVFTPDLSLQYKFSDRIQLLVFDASALDLSFNGMPVGELGAEGRVRRLSFIGQDYAKSQEGSKSEKM